MNLVDEFDLLSEQFADRCDPHIESGCSAEEHPDVVDSSFEAPLLNISNKYLAGPASRGRGQVIGIACSNENLVVATSRGFVLRYYWDDSANEKVLEAEIPRQSDAKIQQLFLDATGNHLLFTLKSSTTIETYYLNKRSTKPRPLTKLKGSAVTAVAWQRPFTHQARDEYGKVATAEQPWIRGSFSPDDGRGNMRAEDNGPSDTVSGDVLLGSESGQVWETCLDQQSRHEAAVKLVYELKAEARTVCCLHMNQHPVTGRRVVFLATPTSVYIFAGGSNYEALFSTYAAMTRVEPVLTAPRAGPTSQLHLYLAASSAAARLPCRFAWLVGAMLYHGDLDLDQAIEPGFEVSCLLNLSTMALEALAQPPPSSASSSSGRPADEASGGGAGTAADLWPAGSISMVLTEYHFVLLLADKLLAVNRVSGRLVAEVALQGRGSSPVSSKASPVVGAFQWLIKDEEEGTLLLGGSESVQEVVIHNEARDMWRVYCENQDFPLALKLCSSSVQRDAVYLAEADTRFEEGHYEAAAEQYAKIVNGKPAFEDIALKLVDSGSVTALTLFLATRLSLLGAADRAQATCVAAWLTELYLDQINQALLEAGGQPSDAYRRCEAALASFLQTHVTALDPAITSSLLATYGRLDDLCEYALARQDYEGVLEVLVQKPGGYARALAICRRPSVSPELIYKFAPMLVAAAPRDTVDFFISAHPPLDPKRLIPALLRYGEAGSRDEGSAGSAHHEVLRYVQYAIHVARCDDPALHNFAVALLTLEGDERPLLELLRTARHEFGGPLFDPEYALRLVMSRHKHRAAVDLLCELGMYFDAVSLALTIDLELAKCVAGRPPDDEPLRRKLWLTIAQHIVQGGDSDGAGSDAASRIKQAVELLKEADGLLKIEDILPFFPDFVTIDNFKDAICASLQRYNAQIAALQREMNEATEIADLLRRDLKRLQHRSAAVPREAPCARCGRPVGEAPPNNLGLPSGGMLPQLYAFPSSLVYHTACCAAEVLERAPTVQAARIKSVMARLSRAPVGASTVVDGNGGEENVKELLQQLWDEVGAEDPRNGTALVRLVDTPFIADKDALEAESWRL